MNLDVLESINVSNVKVVREAVTVAHVTLVRGYCNSVHCVSISIGGFGEYLNSAYESFLLQTKHRYMLLFRISHNHKIFRP